MAVNDEWDKMRSTRAKVAPILDDTTREQIRDETRAAIREALAEFRGALGEVSQQAKAVSRDLFSLDAHGAALEAAGRQANEALGIAASLRHEWLEAKLLAKMFEQREFLGLPQVRVARQSLLSATGIDRVGENAPPEVKIEMRKLAEENARLHAQLAEREGQLAQAEAKANEAIKMLPAGGTA